MSIYAVLQPRGTQDAGVWSLLEQVDPGEFRIVARGAKDDLVRLSRLLNDTPRTTVNLPLPVISLDEVKTYNQTGLAAARASITPESNSGITLYKDPASGRYYAADAAEFLTGQPFVRRLSDSPQA